MKLLYIFDALVILGLIALAWVWVGESREMHRSFEVRETGNVSDCEDLLPPKNSVDEGNIATCFQSLAEHYGDASYCDSITGAVTDWGEVMFAASRDMCNETIAYTTLDIDVCDKVSNPERCKGVVLRKLNYKESQRSSEESSESSSASEISDTDIAPFDGCPGIYRYSKEDWYGDLQQEFPDLQGPFVVTEACLSRDWLIFIYNNEEGTHIFKYVLAENKLIEAQGPKMDADSFGKRGGSSIPLVRLGCTLGTYNVLNDTYVVTNSQCGTDATACTDDPQPTATGLDIYPKFTKYQHLRWLGQLFTAAECGEARLQKLYGGRQNLYRWGSGLLFEEEPSGPLKTLLEQIGYECSENYGCREMNLWDVVTVETLLQLQPYAEQIASDDCRNCG